MCGLFGFSRTTRFTELMTPSLAIAMSQRGKDSWGVTDGEFIYKTKGSILDTYINCGLDGPLYHTRAASVGDPTDRNAHPFQFEHEGKVVVGAHNGHIHNHIAIKEKYDRKDVQVDSEHIFMHLAENKPLGDIGGYGAVIWYEYPTGHPEQRVRYFSRFNHEALHFMRLKTGEIAFASTKSSLEMAAMFADADVDIFYETEAGVKYSIENDTLVIEGSCDWAKAPLTSTRYTSASASSGFGGGHYSNDLCPVNGCCNRIFAAEFICKTCMQKLARDVYGADS